MSQFLGGATYSGLAVIGASDFRLVLLPRGGVYSWRVTEACFCGVMAWCVCTRSNYFCKCIYGTHAHIHTHTHITYIYIYTPIYIDIHIYIYIYTLYKACTAFCRRASEMSMSARARGGDKVCRLRSFVFRARPVRSRSASAWPTMQPGRKPLGRRLNASWLHWCNFPGHG